MARRRIPQSEHSELIAKANAEITRASEKAAKCMHRLHYHFMAPANWLNDPNGLIQFQGDYHMFYQHHPYSPDWGPMHWGHAKSKDLIHWEHLPIALAPCEEYDQHGCFSGSAVNDDGTLTLIYTGNMEDDQRSQVQCIATSTDGINFTKYSGNPVIGAPPADGSADFRDPKVWNKDGLWYMVVGSAKERARILLYRSPDLRNWAYMGVAFESQKKHEFMWECPDLFPLVDKHVLIVSPMVMHGNKTVHGKSLGFIGDFDYQTGKFSHVHFQEIDHGFDFYASQTFLDDQGRRILIGWMDIWSGLKPTRENGWSCAMTLPRILSFSAEGLLLMQPVPELRELRRDHKQFTNIFVTPVGSNYMGDLTGDSAEIIAVFEMPEDDNSIFGVKVRCSVDQEQFTSIYYDCQTGEVCVDRDKSGLDNRGISRGKLELVPGDKLQLQIFIDRSSIEVFVNEGRAVITNRIYPDPSSVGIDLFAERGAVNLHSLDFWRMDSIWN